MSSGTRRLNYTGRQRIRRQDVDIRVHQPREADPPVMSARLDLSSYTLPPEARVVIEAYRQTAWQRFEYGTVAAVREPDDRTLREFGSEEGVRFRVKVIQPPTPGAAAGRILAQADSIEPDRDGPRQSMLPLEPDPNLRDEVWRLDLDEDDGPLVRVSTHLVRDRHELARSPAFLALVLPEVLRRILAWALEDGLPDDDDEMEWRSPRGRWIRYGCGLLGQAEPPEELGDPNDGADARDRWIDEVVTRFCREHRIAGAFERWWRNDPAPAAGGAA